MVKIKKKQNETFTIVSNKVIKDDKLSFKARGLFIYLWSQPENWDYYETEVVKHTTDGLASLKSGLKELENNGYLKRYRNRDESGQLKESVWTLSEYGDLRTDVKPVNISDDIPLEENPQVENPPKENPMLDNPMLENPMLEKPTLENRTLQNTNNTKHLLNKTLTKENNSSAEPEQLVNDKPVKKDKPKKQVQKWIKHEDAIKEIIDYLNAKLGTNYSPTTKETVNFIKQDFEKGHGVYDLKQVIDNMYDAWIGTDMFKYMRPSTLFRPSHVENYLNQGQLQKQNKAKRPVAFGGFVKRKTEPSPTELSQVHRQNFDKQQKVSQETLSYLDNAFKDLEGDDADGDSR